MSAVAECGGAFRGERGFILSLASFDAWRVSGHALYLFAARALIAVRTYTGSPHCADAQSNQGGTDHADTVSDLVIPGAAGYLLAPP
jgi:hypothetical protein